MFQCRSYVVSSLQAARETSFVTHVKLYIRYITQGKHFLTSASAANSSKIKFSTSYVNKTNVICAIYLLVALLYSLAV